MIENLTLQYPSWYIIFCGLAGIIVAGAMYYKEQRFLTENKWLTPLLFLLRFLSVSLISFFLLSPMIRAIQDNVQQPIIVYAKDVSESVSYNRPAEEISDFNASINSMVSELSNSYDVRTLSFGSEIRTELQDSFTEKVTNLSNLLEYIQSNYADQNVGAVVISSDGIYNEGKNPLYSTGSITAPIFTIAQGDTTRQTDLSVKNVFANQIVYLGDKFSMQIDIQAYNCNKQNTRLRVRKIEENGNQEVLAENLTIADDNYFATKEIILDADKVGTNRFRISLTSVPGEVSSTNNSKDIFVQVLDARQKVLILAESPHPDLAALSQILSQNKNYESKIKIKGKDDYTLSQYDQVIFHNLPSTKNKIGADLATLKQTKTPHLFIVGAQMDITAFNQSQDILKIGGNGQTLEEVMPNINNAFKNFTTSPELKNSLKTFPPLTAPFGEYSLISNASSLMFQNIRSVETDYPLISFQEKNGVQTGIIIGEGIWKWRLFDYLQTGNYDLTTELINKIIQYISTKKDNRKFIVSTAKNVYKENETIQFSAQLYNDNYELVNEPEIFISIFGSNNQEYQYVMNRNNDFYGVDIGLLPPGTYRFTTRVNYNGKELTDRGRFSVQEIQLESFDLEAKHFLLSALSEQSNGKLFYENQIPELTSTILNNKTIKPVLYQNVKTNPLIDHKWIFFLLLGLISAEWILRRYFGSY